MKLKVIGAIVGVAVAVVFAIAGTATGIEALWIVAIGGFGLFAASVV